MISDDPDIPTNIGKLLANLSKFQEAILLFDKALSIDANNVGALYNKGQTFDELGKTEDAKNTTIKL